MEQYCKVVRRPYRSHLFPTPQPPVVPLQAGGCLEPRLPRVQMTQHLPQGFPTPVRPLSSGQCYYPCRMNLGLRQAGRCQQSPRCWPAVLPDIPPVLPQDMAMAELMRRLPAIDHLDARCDGRIPVAHRMRRLNRSLLPGPSSQFPNNPKATPFSSRITFNSAAPVRVLVHNPSNSKTRPRSSGRATGSRRSQWHRVLLTNPNQWPLWA